MFAKKKKKKEEDEERGNTRFTAFRCTILAADPNRIFIRRYPAFAFS